MGNDDLTIEILKSIRDELKSHGAKLDQTNERLDQSRTELGSRLDRMAHEQIRLATAIVGLEGRMGDLAEGQRAIVAELKSHGEELRGLNQRMDHFLTGPVGSTVRNTAARVDRVEERLDAMEKRLG